MYTVTKMWYWEQSFVDVMVRDYIYATGVLIKKYKTLVKIVVKHISRERNDCKQYSLRSNRFQSSYCVKKVRAGAKKKVEGEGEGEKRKRLPANPTILENAPWYFTVRFICKLTARQNRNITNRLPLDYQICKITLFSNRTRSRRLQKL